MNILYLDQIPYSPLSRIPKLRKPSVRGTSRLKVFGLGTSGTAFPGLLKDLTDFRVPVEIYLFNAYSDL